MTRKAETAEASKLQVALATWCLLGMSATCLAVGCAKTSASVMPSVHLDSYKTYYVARHERDKSNVAGMIAEDLRRRGLEAEFGPERSALREEKVVVTYEDRWAWDITTYMLSLKVDFRDAKTDELLASGQSYRPSLQRRSPEEMVREVLAEIFGTR